MRLINRAGTVSAGDSEQDVSYGIEFNPFMASLLSDKLYTDKPTACWRELYANAHDESDNIQVQLPTFSEPTCVIWDNGTGLDKEELIGLFCTYGASNKRDTNSKIGGFGVGSKVLFSYTDTFSASSVKEGIKTTIVCYKDDEGMPTARILAHQDSDEQSGTRIEWAVSEYDAEGFKSVGLEVFARFKNKPTFLCNTVHEWVNPYSFETDTWAVRTKEFSKSLPKSGTGLQIVMGGIAYPVSSSNLSYSEYDTICRSSIDVFAPIGSVQLAASREALSYDEKTTSYVTKRLTAMKLEAEQMVEDQVANAGTWYEKEIARDKIVTPVPFLSGRRQNIPPEMGVYHTVRRWQARGIHVPTRLNFDSDSNFLLEPTYWNAAMKYMASDFLGDTSVVDNRYHGGYQCVLRFPEGTNTPSGFTTRVARFAQKFKLQHIKIINDEVYQWCLDNDVPTDEVIIWDSTMQEAYKPEYKDTSYVEYRRKKADETTLFQISNSYGNSYLSLNERGVSLGHLDENEERWFLLANNGTYRKEDNPGVAGRETTIGYLCAIGTITIDLVPKSYANVLGGNFININKEKERFDEFLKKKVKATDMLDGYVVAHLRDKLHEFVAEEGWPDHRVVRALDRLQAVDEWDVPSWFQRFTKVMIAGESVYQSGRSLENVVSKQKGDAKVEKELDKIKFRLYRKPLALHVVISHHEAGYRETINIASTLSGYLK